MTNAPLGRLSIVPPRAVWPHEAHDFTPWLLANVDVLSDLLGMELTLEVAEHPVGDFSLDLMGRDEASGQVVIVENQLEVSDHTHLGQILTYAAGTDPTTIVWVAAAFRPEHREAIDWLNSRTDENTRFFAVEIEVVRIGDSEPAPNFRLIAQPNDWAKTVKAITQASGGMTDRERLCWDFWESLRQRLITEHPDWTRSGQSTKSPFFGMSAGLNGVNWSMWVANSKVTVGLRFETSDAELNRARHARLLARRDVFESAFGGPLDWPIVEGQKMQWVYASFEDSARDLSDRTVWPGRVDWLIQTCERLRAAFDAAGGLAAIRD